MYKYFIEPVLLEYGYNIVNTLVYALVFVFFTYIVYKILRKLKIEIDRRLILSITSWIILGIFVRILEDSGIIKSYLLVTPNIWLIFLFLIILLLLTSKFLEKKYQIPYFKIMFITGVILAALLLPFLKIRNVLGLFYFITWFIPWIIFLKLIRWSTENKTILSLHLFDATATFVSLKYFGYFEQHVLPRTIIELTGTSFSFVIVKFIVIVSVLYILDKYSDDEDFTNYLKIVIGILGFVPGLRDLLRLILLI